MPIVGTTFRIFLSLPEQMLINKDSKNVLMDFVSTSPITCHEPPLPSTPPNCHRNINYTSLESLSNTDSNEVTFVLPMPNP